MGKIATYKNDKRRCYSQIKLDNKERILISIAGSPTPSTKILKLSFAGLIPTKTIWEYNPNMAGGFEAYARNLVLMLTDNKQPNTLDNPKHPLDLIVDKLLPCRSIDDVLSVVLNMERRFHNSSKDYNIAPSGSGSDESPHQTDFFADMVSNIQHCVKVVSDYGFVLEKSSSMVYCSPISLLPHSKEEIKTAIKHCITALNINISGKLFRVAFPSEHEYLTSKEFLSGLKVGFVELSKFVSDEEAEIGLEVQGKFANVYASNPVEIMTEAGMFEQLQPILNKVSKEAESLNIELNEHISGNL